MTRRAVFDNLGQFMLYANEGYVEAALKRGELTEGEDGVLTLNPKPIRALTPQEKRNLELAKQREERSNR